MTSETSGHIEQNTLTDVVNSQESEPDTIPEVENIQQKKIEQINHECNTLSEEQYDEKKTQTIDATSISEGKATVVSESAIQPTLSFSMGPVELFEYFALSTPRLLCGLYLLIFFTWNYLGRYPLLLLGLGVAFGYFLRANTVTNEVKEKFVMARDINMRSLSSLEVLKSVEKVKSAELAITPKIDKTLDKTFKFITRDIIDFYYGPINPRKDSEFSIQVRNAMNVMAMNLASCFRNLDKVELGIMSSFAVSNTFIVHLREYRKFIATNTSLSVYCSQNESSVLTQSTNRETQAQILYSVSYLMNTRLLPPSEVDSHILMTFLSELWANHIFQTALDTICDSDWINRTIVEYLTDISPIDAIDEHDATLFHELANSLEAVELAEKLKQPLDSPNFVDPEPHETSDENKSSILNNDSTMIQPNYPLTELSTSPQTNLFPDSKTEICDEPTGLVKENHVETKAIPEYVSQTISSNNSFGRSNKSINLQNVLSNPEIFAELMAFLEDKKAANLLRFWLQADSFRKIAANEMNINLIQEDSLRIFKSYFGETANYPVKINGEGLVKQCANEISKKPTADCFIMLQEYIFVVLEREYFDDFIKSMRSRGEDMSFLIKDKHIQKEVVSPSEDDDKSRFVSERIPVEEKQSHTLEDSVLSSISDNSEFSDQSLSEENNNSENLQANSNEQSNSISVEALGELTNIPENFVASPTKSSTSEKSYEIDDATESNHESIMERPKPDLTGVRIKMTDVSEAPNKYIYSTKSLGYMIEVEQPGSKGWIMTRSYVDFEKMHQSLIQAFPKAEKVTMPRVMLKKNHEACESLERYLNILLSDVTLCESDALQKFMQRDGLPIKDLENVNTKMTRGLSILSAKSKSVVNLLTYSNDSKDKRIHTNSNHEESFSLKKSTEILRSSEAAFKKISELLPRISTDFQKTPEESSEKITTTTTTTRRSIGESSGTGTPTTVSESESSSIIMIEASSDRSSIVDKPENSYDDTSDSGEINLISKRRVRPNKQLTGQDIDLLIDTIFALVEEIFDLSVKSQWHLRRTVLSVLREVVRRSYTEAIKASFLTYIDTLSTEEKVTSMIENFTNSFWPNGTWAEPSPLRTEEEKLKTKEEAKKLLLQKVVPSSIKQVMGSENSRIMIGRLVDGFLAEKEVVRGMGVNILESVIKLIIAE